MMKGIKKFFETPKKALISSLCLVVGLAVIGAGAVITSSTIAKGSSIGTDNAQNFAFADAGIDPKMAEQVHTKFDFEDGQFVYEVEFVADGTEYEYLIKASDGTVLKKEMETVSLDGTGTVTAKITMDEAKEIALKDAGIAESNVTFTKEELDLDDGVSVYELEFFIDNVEYEYEILAETGMIYSKSKEEKYIPAPNTQESQTTTQTSQTEENTQQTLEPIKPENIAPEKPEQAVQSHPSQSMDAAAPTVSYIGADKAKETAASHAGFSVSDVHFSKIELEEDDGEKEYEIEFYKNGIEYEYTIDAVSGTIKEWDSEREEHSYNMHDDDDDDRDDDHDDDDDDDD